MKKNFIQAEIGQKVDSQTAFLTDCYGQQVINTQLAEQLPITSEDLNHLGLEIGLHRRGSFLLQRNPDGTVGIIVRPYKTIPKRETHTQTLRVTEHCRLTRNRRHWRLVLEVPLSCDANRLADIIDDEAYDMREWLNEQAQTNHE